MQNVYLWKCRRKEEADPCTLGCCFKAWSQTTRKRGGKTPEELKKLSKVGRDWKNSDTGILKHYIQSIRGQIRRRGPSACVWYSTVLYDACFQDTCWTQVYIHKQPTSTSLTLIPDELRGKKKRQDVELRDQLSNRNLVRLWKSDHGIK